MGSRKIDKFQGLNEHDIEDEKVQMMKDKFAIGKIFGASAPTLAAAVVLLAAVSLSGVFCVKTKTESSVCPETKPCPKCVNEENLPSDVTVAVTVVDEGGFTGQYSSLAFDSNNIPHIIYYSLCQKDNSQRGCLKHASADPDTGKWKTEVIEEGGPDFGTHNSLVIGNDDQLHVSFYDGARQVLKYARHNKINWATYMIDDQGDVGTFSSIALDVSNNAYISYVDGTWHDLKMAIFAGGDVVKRVVDSGFENESQGGVIDFSTSIKVNLDGEAIIAYINPSNRSVNLARFSPSANTWEYTKIADVQSRYLSMALDYEEKPQIAYDDFSSGLLKYARYDGRSWIKEDVDSLGNTGRHNSIAISPGKGGLPAISYMDARVQDRERLEAVEDRFPGRDRALDFACVQPGAQPLGELPQLRPGPAQVYQPVGDKISQKSEVRSQKSEVRSQKSEVSPFIIQPQGIK
jgi:hypothetical protein